MSVHLIPEQTAANSGAKPIVGPCETCEGSITSRITVKRDGGEPEHDQGLLAALPDDRHAANPCSAFAVE